MPKRIALITNILAPYRLPVWHRLTVKTGQVRVFYPAQREPNRPWTVDDLSDYAFEVESVPGRVFYFPGLDLGFHCNLSIWSALRRYNPSAIVVTGYESPIYLMSIAYAKRHRLPLIIWFGSHASSSRLRRGPLGLIRANILRLADSYLTYGTRSTQYLVDMGIVPERIVTGVNTVDVEKIAKLVRDYSKSTSAAICGVVRFLYVGQLIERKGIRQLVAAFSALPRDKVELTIVGYGPLEAELKVTIKAKGLDNVRLVGATKKIEETARYYAHADVLIMPSLREVWGLVINEALAAGLWVLSSKYAGATPDLVERAPVQVGRPFDPLDEHDFHQALKEALARALARDRNAIMRWGLQFTTDRYGDALVNAVKKALEVKKAPW